jgi:organic hydroperoxide reductase OsmC/OhrA
MAHSYPFTTTWRGSTAAEYGRDAALSAPGKSGFGISSAPEYAGNPALWNPEDLLGAALGTCHMLTFLALAAKAKVVVTGYDGHGESILDTVDKVTSVTEIRLNPVIRVAPGTSKAKVEDLFQKAHKYCFVANSVRSKVILAPRVVEA